MGDCLRKNPPRACRYVSMKEVHSLESSVTSEANNLDVQHVYEVPNFPPTRVPPALYGGNLPGRWYGLIKYECGKCLSYLASPAPTCDNCLFCVHNELIPKCQSVWVPLLISFSVLTFLTLTFYITHRFLMATTCWSRRYKHLRDNRKSSCL